MKSRASVMKSVMRAPGKSSMKPRTRYVEVKMVTFVRSSMSQSLGALAQHVFLDLTGGGGRHRAEYHPLRDLEAREVLAAPVDVLGLGGLHAGLELDDRARPAAPWRCIDPPSSPAERTGSTAPAARSCRRCAAP